MPLHVSTIEFDEHVARLFVKPTDNQGRMVHAALGLGAEAGELMNTVRKHWVAGAELDRENLIEECGDVLFYASAFLQTLGLTLADAMIANQLKLARRYPQGYSDAAAIAQADKATS